MPFRTPTAARAESPSISHHTPSPGSRSATSLKPGTVIDGFRIERPLGRGGMGVVYAAWDVAHDRPVALKVLGAAIDNPHTLARFHREATTVARLHHPGIVALFQVGQTDDFSYLVMERVDGITLREWIGCATRPSAERPTPADPPPTLACTLRFDVRPVELAEAVQEAGPAPLSVTAKGSSHVRRVAELLRDLADALAHAHATGVTHRDLKPDNVMVRPDGRVVLIDFGLARSFADTTLTTHSGLIGTPLYMAPEQLAGKPADPRSDVYALGLIGYELLSLSVPFRATCVEGLLGEVLHKPAPPLTGRNPAVPVGLASIVHQAMAKNPAERYQSAAQLRDDLARFLHDERVTAVGYKYRFDPKELIAVRPKRVTLSAYVAALVAGVLGLFGLFATAINSNPSSLVVSAFGGVFLVAARQLLSGRRGALACGVGMAVVMLAWAAWAMWQSLTTNLQQTPRLLIVALIGLPTVAAVGLLAALFSRRGRDWFRQMREKRREFDAECG